MKKWFLFLSAVMIVVIAGCGGTAQESEQNENSNKGNNKQSEGNAVTIEHGMGETTLEETPKRIVVLEWVYGEDLLALGIQPVGMADIEGYNSWVNIEPELPEDLQDVGTRQEPNLEAISRLNPDLIITAKYRHEAIYEQLDQIAPTLAFEPYPQEGEGNQYQEMIDTFNKIAKVVGKEDKAEEVLNNMEASFEEAQAQLSEAGLDGEPFVLSQAYSANNTPTIRLFTDNGMVTQIMQKIGLENALESDSFQVYGFEETTVEALQNYQDAHFFYIVQENDNVFENQLKGNPTWEKLKFVQEDKTYALPGDTWTFGGPLSAEIFANQVVEAMTGKQ